MFLCERVLSADCRVKEFGTPSQESYRSVQREFSTHGIGRAESLARLNDKRTPGRKLEFLPVVARVGLGVLASEWLLKQAGAHVMKPGARWRYQVEKEWSWGWQIVAEDPEKIWPHHQIGRVEFETS
ncbi:hypothetical protein DPX16_15265 [Anabarilius grahami]|uniref:Uncharacterized protein n=1 Tax=Anabarilius grahami TaxID=495550 RepID=A0A3N0XVJ1_ANAGA|nr:hypothetical protein DPX16_15265 [Anabarilius grahami]